MGFIKISVVLFASLWVGVANASNESDKPAVILCDLVWPLQDDVSCLG